MTEAVGLITEPHQAEAVLQEGHADLVAMARELMTTPTGRCVPRRNCAVATTI